MAERRFWDEAVETLEREQLLTLQLDRLRHQVDRLAAISPFHAAKLRQAGAEPGDLTSLDALARLPVTTKEELREEQARRPPFGTFVAATPDVWRELHPSTGTTGAPVATIWSARDVATISDFTARTLWQLGVRPGDVVQNGFAYGLWVAGMSVHYGAQRVGCLVVPTGASVSTERQIEYLQRAGTTVLLATPSYGLHIGEGLRERGIDPAELPLRIGGFGGEGGTATEATRAKLEAALAIDAYDYFGLAEVGPTFGSECEAKAGPHFAEDHVLVECVDPVTRLPVADGEVGVLVFTHLTREATPMLRYWSNDYARLSREPCACGRTHVRAVGGILGRHDDLLVYKGAKFYPVQVESRVRSFAELSDEFRIEVRRQDGSALVERCTVVGEWALEPAPGVEERLRHALREELGVTPAVRIEPRATLERTTFKAQRIVELDEP